MSFCVLTAGKWECCTGRSQSGLRCFQGRGSASSLIVGRGACFRRGAKKSQHTLRQVQSCVCPDYFDPRTGTVERSFNGSGQGGLSPASVQSSGDVDPSKEKWMTCRLRNKRREADVDYLSAKTQDTRHKTHATPQPLLPSSRGLAVRHYLADTHRPALCHGQISTLG